jgi:hypothetical protein
MRSLALLLTVFSVAVFGQVPAASLNAQAQAEAYPWQPESNSFYINGVAYRYAVGNSYAVVAAAMPGIGGKYLGIKLHIFNHSRQSITVRPGDFHLVDALANRRLPGVAAVEVAGHKRQPLFMKFAGNAIGGSPDPLPDALHPQWSELVRALQPEVASARRLDSSDPHYPGQSLQLDGPDCDIGCQLRNREVNSSLNTRRQEDLADAIQHDAFLANTVPPQCDVEGVLYFPMPRRASVDAQARRQSKSYAVTLTVPLGSERFHLDFPVE